MESYPASQIMQAGFRDRIGSNMSLIVNGMYRVQRDLPEQLDVNMKLLLQDKVWVGMGHRFDYATNVQFGVLAGVLRLGYVLSFRWRRAISYRAGPMSSRPSYSSLAGTGSEVGFRFGRKLIDQKKIKNSTHNIQPYPMNRKRTCLVVGLFY